MKIIATVLAVSLAANVAGWFLLARAPARRLATGTGSSSRAAAASPLAPARPTSPALARPANPNGSSWADLNSDDLEILVARLRAAGFPPRILRAVVMRLLDERFRAREQEISGGADELSFWQNPARVFERPEYRTAVNQLSREREALAKKLLGPDQRLASEEARLSYQNAWGNLSAQKITALMALFEQESELRDSLSIPGRAVSEEQRQKLLAIDRRQRKEIERLLTPEELEQYDRRASATATNLRYSSLQYFQATEEEYLTLYRLFRPHEDQLAWSYREPTPAEAALRERLEASLQPQIKAALGPERYADYLHAKASEHAQLNRIVARLELPLSAARAVVTVQEETTKRAKVVRTNATLTPAQRTAELTALAEAAEGRIAPILGARGLAAYKSYSGQWLTSLTRSPSPPK